MGSRGRYLKPTEFGRLLANLRITSNMFHELHHIGKRGADLGYPCDRFLLACLGEVLAFSPLKGERLVLMRAPDRGELAVPDDLYTRRCVKERCPPQSGREATRRVKGNSAPALNWRQRRQVVTGREGAQLRVTCIEYEPHAHL